MSKIKIYKIILICLIIAAIIIGALVVIKYFNLYKNETEAKQVIANIKEELKNNDEPIKEINQQIQGNKVVGIIKIPKIELEYPILETTTKETLNLSITKFWGNQINEIGNVSLAGHNNLNGTMFGKTKKLQVGDVIELTDIQNVTLKYKVFKMYIIDPNDISCILPEQEGTREVTLITCTNGNKNRLIVKAREQNI
ncbi:MAG: sortase [Clostridia bacterium]|nr:sortase [Clostridia bacterium]